MQAIAQGLKVVELATVLAGPAVGMFFAELGATVIKIEHPGTKGDVTRHWKSKNEDPTAATSAYFHAVNWGKTHLFLDISTEDGFEQMMAYVAEADIVITNYREGAAEKLGIDFSAWQNRFPSLIIANISAYGKGDTRPGFDALLQAETGWMSMNGQADGLPTKLPVALIDLLAAHQLKQGILAALWQREKTSKGSFVSVSLFDASLAALANQASNWLNLRENPQRMGSRHPNISPYGDVFSTRDGVHLMVATGTEAHFIQLWVCLGMAENNLPPSFKTNQLRLQHRDELYAVLQSAFSTYDYATLNAAFAKAEVPVSKINTVAETLETAAAQSLILVSQDENGQTSNRVKTAVFKIESL